MSSGRLHDVLIVGGGPAGASAAIRLARAGRDVVLLERERGPHHKVCGEFLSVEARVLLDELEIDLGGEVAVDRIRLREGTAAAEARLPFLAAGLSRYALDERLLDGAAAAGAAVARGARVTRLEPAGGAWVATTESGDRFRGRAAILATGKHDVRGMPRRAGAQDDLIGFKMHFYDPRVRAVDRCVDLFLFDGGYGGIQSVEDGRLNLCLLVRRAAFARYGRRSDVLLDSLRQNRAVTARLGRATQCWPRPLAVAAIPYGHVARGGGRPGLYAVGDQFAVIPSFSGDGIAIALHTAKRAANALLAGHGADDYATAARRELIGKVRLATLLSRIAVSQPGRIAVGGTFRLAPALLRIVAGATRIPGYA